MGNIPPLDVINKAVEAAKIGKEIAPRTFSEADDTGATLLGFFNNVVLFWPKVAIINCEHNLKVLKQKLEEKVAAIPEDKLCNPKPSVVGLTLEALKYSLDEEELRDMYINLLASSAHVDKAPFVHPSFVEVIRQMDSVDAQLFCYLASATVMFPVIRPILSRVGTTLMKSNAMPDWFFGVPVPGVDVFQMSTSLNRLARLGLVEIRRDATVSGRAEQYSLLENASELSDILRLHNYGTSQYELKTERAAFYINDFGKSFAKACLW